MAERAPAERVQPKKEKLSRQGPQGMEVKTVSCATTKGEIMTYCSTTDIQTVLSHNDLVQLTNDSGGDTVDTTKIEDAISYVSDVMDSYLRGRGDIPSSELKTIAVDFTVYRLYSRRMYTQVPDYIQRVYTDVIRKLQNLQNSNIKTNKSRSKSSTNKYFDEIKWDEYDSWLS